MAALPIITPGDKARAILDAMVAAPRITEHYWKAANALELAYINANIRPEYPDEVDFDTRVVAKRLRRGALPNGALAVWWQAEYGFVGFWTDIDGNLVDPDALTPLGE